MCLYLKQGNRLRHQATLGSDPRGNLIRLDNALAQMPQRMQAFQTQLDEAYHQQEAAKAELGKPFPYEEELRDKTARMIFLDAELNLDASKGGRKEQAIAYRKAGYSKKFLSEHESEIILHKAAKQFFDEQGLKKLPTVKSLQAEYAQLLSEKKAMYADYQKAKEDMRSLQTAKANVDRILGDDSLTTEREFEKDGR